MVAVHATVFKISNLSGFVASYLTSPNNPEPSTFGPTTKCRAYLKLSTNNWEPSSLTNITLNTTTRPVRVQPAGHLTGNFSIQVTGIGGLPNCKGIVVVEELLQTITAEVLGLPVTFEIWGVVYRSAPFAISSVTNTHRKIWYYRVPVPSSAYLTQSAIDEVLTDAMDSLPAGVETLSAHISSSGLLVSGSGRGATITFPLSLRGSHSHDLDTLLEPKIGTFDFDLPGPDVLTTLCVNEEDIENEVRRSVGRIVRTDVSANIRDSIVQAAAEATEQPSEVLESWLDINTTISVASVSYPHVSSGYAVKIEPSVGVPLRLY